MKDTFCEELRMHFVKN